MSCLGHPVSTPDRAIISGTITSRTGGQFFVIPRTFDYLRSNRRAVTSTLRPASFAMLTKSLKKAGMSSSTSFALFGAGRSAGRAFLHLSSLL